MRVKGEGHHRKCPFPLCPFGYFSDKRKVTQGMGAEPQKGVWGRRLRYFFPVRRSFPLTTVPFLGWVCWWGAFTSIFPLLGILPI